ncbi:hypothetical protein CANARDRAFT_15543 [[Candida] arabinofermentans NRRL YB-2248]|uniref:CAP-Gly domain-containing protein n=1 Tax=[Candida] arabinofermentans NRRL YB-2248 TaxID=983967 RepID=A0A1E4T951_9ASCO|nr:hypothetical protein CANARDRAFT_15543 [[Candida] arabinofermentans NRRL YB-2248]
MSYKVNDRVSLNGSSNGTIKFVGNTEFQAGEWIGIQLDTPTGKNDGSINGIRYFTCDQQGLYGVFVRSSMIQLLGSSVEMNNGDSSRVKKMELIVKQLESKLQNMRGEIADLSKKLSKLKEENENMGLIISSLEENLEHELVDKDVLAEQNKVLEDQLIKQNEAYSTLDKQLKALQTELAKRKEVDELLPQEFDDVTNSPEVLFSLQKRIKSLELELLTLEEESADSNILLNEQLLHLELKVAELNLVSEEHSVCQSKIEKLENHNTSLQEQLDSLSDSQFMIERLTLENEELSIEISRLKTTISELEQLQETDRDLQKYNDEIEAELRLNIRTLTSELEQKKANLESLANKNTNLEEIIMKLQQQNKQGGRLELTSVEADYALLNLKHENSKLLGLKVELEIQRTLRKVSDLSIKEYSSLLQQFPQIHQFDLLAIYTFIRFKILTTQLQAFHQEHGIIEPLTFESYSTASSHLKNSHYFGMLKCDASYYFELCQANTNNAATSVVERLREYTAELESNFDNINDFSLIDDMDAEPSIKFRESAIRLLTKEIEKLDFCLLLLNLIGKASKLLGVSCNHDTVETSIHELHQSIEGKLHDLSELRTKGEGLVDPLVLELNEIDELLSIVLLMSDKLETIDVDTDVDVNMHIRSPITPNMTELVSSISFKPSFVNVSEGKQEEKAHITESHTVDEKGPEDSTAIDELELKVSILSSKLMKYEASELQAREITLELAEVKEENKILNDDLLKQNTELLDVSKKLSEAENKLLLYTGGDDDDLVEELQRVEKSKLINEISMLRDLISRIERIKINPVVDIEVEYDWLLKDLTTRHQHHKFHSNDVEKYSKNKIERLFELNQKYRILPTLRMETGFSVHYSNILYDDLIGYREMSF